MLIGNRGEVKLADLGLSVQITPTHSGGFHVPVCTLLYQAPEQLFQTPKGYDFKADVWGMGCIFAELLLGEPLFCAARSFAQLVELIMQRFGGDVFEAWPEVQASKVFQTHQHRLKSGSRIQEYFLARLPNIDPLALDLLEKLLSVDPKARLSAIEALGHPFFHEAPLPLEPTQKSAY